jgi:hypothetical protein
MVSRGLLRVGNWGEGSGRAERCEEQEAYSGWGLGRTRLGVVPQLLGESGEKPVCLGLYREIVLRERILSVSPMKPFLGFCLESSHVTAQSLKHKDAICYFYIDSDLSHTTIDYRDPVRSPILIFPKHGRAEGSHEAT